MKKILALVLTLMLVLSISTFTFAEANVLENEQNPEAEVNDEYEWIPYHEVWALGWQRKRDLQICIKTGFEFCGDSTCWYSLDCSMPGKSSSVTLSDENMKWQDKVVFIRKDLVIEFLDRLDESWGVV